MFRHPLIRLLFLALLVWGVFSFLLKHFGAGLVLILIVLAAVAALTTSMLRHRRAQLRAIYGYPVARQFIDLICKITGYQPPVEGTCDSTKAEQQLTLRDPLDFHKAAERLRQVVRGHNSAITRLSDYLHGAIVLRTRSAQQKGLPPLATFLLAGRAGIGKKYLAIKFGRMIYQKPAVLHLSMGEYSDPNQGVEILFGNHSKAGLIVEHVKSKPFHIVVLDDIHMAGAPALQALSHIFKHGSITDPSTGAPVSFQHCVFFLVTDRAEVALKTAKEKSSSQREWLMQAHEALAEATPLDLKILNLVSDIVYFDVPTAMTQAEIVLLLMLKECRKYKINLEFVDPELLAAEVTALGQERGFELSPARIERLLRDPIFRATRANQSSLKLRQNEITMIHSAGINES